MKVAFLTYPAAFQNVGGGEILLVKLREYLVREGVAVDLFDSWKARVEHYDILHVFGSVKDCLGLVRVANARGVKVAVTPIIWSDWKMGADSFVRHFTKVAWPSFPSSRREILVRADVIFPNSEAEKEQTARLFAVDRKKMRVVPNGVDASFTEADASLFRQKFGSEPFILSVGRIEPRKNQLNLIRGARLAGVSKLVLIGSPVSGYEKYHEACQKEGKGFAHFLPTLPHEDVMLRSAYAACDLFVLQGWFETPGLAALEAALSGARIVATSGGSTREYFTDLVEYLEPSSMKDIAIKITAGLSRPRTSALKERVLSRYTWPVVAKETARLYREAIAR